MKRSGVYQIKCTENEKIYIGQTIDLDRRLYDHLWNLRRGTHHNHYLQRAFDKYGEKRFEFSVLQECSIDDLDKVEKEWIAKLFILSHFYLFLTSFISHIKNLLCIEILKIIITNENNWFIRVICFDFFI